MAHQEDRLRRIGIESFVLVEDSHGRLPSITRRSGRLPSTQVQQHQKTFIYHGPQISTVRLPVITSNEVAQLYGTMVKEPVIASPYYGTMVKEPSIASNEVAQNYGGLEKEPVITSDEAANYYGGFVIVEHGRKKQYR
ncbi:hypothetical protein OIU85_005386 [Salix viminalis]|uniref:Uncharacterized protein n=1 Tax=Salix viminalis TaxID=40686 RepID=A0A9Q0PIN9_SALVM|nr:hypothetical protein OIU85_005386 [Salix viminalis]